MLITSIDKNIIVFTCAVFDDRVSGLTTITSPGHDKTRILAPCTLLTSAAAVNKFISAGAPSIWEALLTKFEPDAWTGLQLERGWADWRSREVANLTHADWSTAAPIGRSSSHRSPKPGIHRTVQRRSSRNRTAHVPQAGLAFGRGLSDGLESCS